MSEHVLIVGGGYSGTMLAINLLRLGDARVTLAERRPDQLARGVAYSAADDSHLLNVRAGNMSAFPDNRDHFATWLVEHGLGDAATFARRTVYGRYLADLLRDAAGQAGARLTIVEGEVVAVLPQGDRFLAQWSDGRDMPFDRVVLAPGNLPPLPPAGLDPGRLADDVYCNDPWAADIAAGLRDSDEVLLIGTGLTAIDAALLLERSGFRGRITAMSRRGLRPRAHQPHTPVPPARDALPERRLSQMTRLVRQDAARIGWRPAIDALRPVTQSLWSGADKATRQRFLRHLRPFWDVHRHRIAPEVADAIDAMVGQGRLAFQAGKIASVEPAPQGAVVLYRPRGGDGLTRRDVRRIVNCTGPQGDLSRTTEALLLQLRDAGLIRADSARLGIDVDATFRAITRDGTPHPRLHAIGPMTRGAMWEIVAVPDIRVQAQELARTVTEASAERV